MTQKKMNKGKGPTSHKYTSIKETVLVNSNAASPVAVVGTANSTTIFALAPLGIYGLKLASGPVIAPALYYNPRLKWLAATAVNFRQYRVTRARLVVVGGVASTATGSFNVTSSGDYMDIFGGVSPSFATGPPGTSMASLANSDKSFPLSIDSSWKYVSGSTGVVSGDQVTFLNVHNVGDLSFCSVAISNNSLSDLGVCYLDYDVEFKGPINLTLNA